MSVLKIKKPDGTWESINNNSIVEVDITLTQSGKAADAKVVGDAISKLSSQMQIPGQVGQIIQVSAVDADGKVTAVEAVDAPDTRVPQFNLTSMGMPTVPVNGTPVHISGLDLTELFEAMMMGPVRITGALDFGVLPQIADDAGLVIGTTVVNPTYTTGGFLCVFHVASSDQTITALVSIDFIYSSGTITAMAKADSNAAEVPYFDLSAMGLPAVPMDGTEVRVSGVDLTGIAAAMQKGPVRVSHYCINGDVTFKVSKTVAPAVQPGSIFADGVVVNDAGNISSTYNLEFHPDTGTIRAVCKPYESSAGTWETIIDYTVPEDCATVKLSTDVNGNPFSLKKAVAYVVVERAADFATANALIRPSFDKTISNTYNDARAFQDSPPTAPTEDGKATAFSIEVEKGIGNSLMLRNYRISSNTSKTLAPFPFALKTGSHEYERYDADTLLPKPTGIDAFNLGAYYTCIGAGTRIKVVGVRE